jgi:hypothetical protein
VDRLDFRHHEIRAFGLDQAAQRGAVEHVDHMAAMGDLHGRRAGIAVHRDHFDREPLQFDRHFLAELARAEEQHAQGVVGMRGADGLHVPFRGRKTRL